MGRRAAALAGVLAFALTGGCILWSLQENKTHTRTLFAMDTVMLFTAQGPQAPEALEEALAEVRRLDALLSAQSPGSEISRLNDGDAHRYRRIRHGFSRRRRRSARRPAACTTVRCTR